MRQAVADALRRVLAEQGFLEAKSGEPVDRSILLAAYSEGRDRTFQLDVTPRSDAT